MAFFPHFFRSTPQQTVSVAWTEQTTRNWSKSLGLMTGVQATIEAGVPEVSKASVQVSHQETSTTTWGEELSVSVNRTAQVTVTLAAGQVSASAVTTVTRGTLDVPYTADVTIRYSDGTIDTLPNQSGVFTGVAVVDVNTSMGA